MIDDASEVLFTNRGICFGILYMDKRLIGR